MFKTNEIFDSLKTALMVYQTEYKKINGEHPVEDARRVDAIFNDLKTRFDFYVDFYATICPPGGGGRRSSKRRRKSMRSKRKGSRKSKRRNSRR